MWFGLRVNQHKRNEHNQMKEDIKNRKRSSVFIFRKESSVSDPWDLALFLSFSLARLRYLLA